MTPGRPIARCAPSAFALCIALACAKSPAIAHADAPSGASHAHGPTPASSGWRGDGTGRYPAARPPVEWSPSKNIAWATRMPAWGNASPAFAGDRLFVTAEPTTLVCVRERDGKILWQRDVTYLDTVGPAERDTARAEQAEAAALDKQLAAQTRELDKLRREARKKDVTEATRARLDALSREVSTGRTRLDALGRYRTPDPIPLMGSASSTPVTDGKAVYAIFGNHVVAAHSLDGKLLWARHFPPDPDVQMHGYPRGQSASPQLVDGKLIVPLGRLRALAPDTGRTLWESHTYRDFGTPAVARVGADAVVLAAEGHATRVSDGKDLGQGKGKPLPFLLYVGPIAGEGTAWYVGNTDPNPPNPAAAIALRLPAITDGAGGWKPEVLHRTDLPKQRQYATPVLVDGALVTLDEVGDLSIIDAATGALVETRALKLGSAFPSPTVAGGYLYVSGSDGLTFVYEARRPFRPVGQNKLEPFRASPLFIGSRMYLRTENRLLAIEQRTAGSPATRPPAKPRRP